MLLNCCKDTSPPLHKHVHSFCFVCWRSSESFFGREKWCTISRSSCSTITLNGRSSSMTISSMPGIVLIGMRICFVWRISVTRVPLLLAVVMSMTCS